MSMMLDLDFGCREQQRIGIENHS